MRSTWISKVTPGSKAPAFTALLDTGDTISSEQLKGKKYILFFYNHDGSETCTKEACNVRDHFKELMKLGFEVFGVSEDSIKKHQRFITKYNLPYRLISDPDHALAKAFDIYGRKEFMGRISDAVHRTTFVINDKGIVAATIHPVDSANHTQQIITSLENS